MSHKEEHIRKLEEELPPWLPRNKDIEKLVEGAAVAAAELETDIENTKQGLILQEATTESEIAQIAVPTDIKPNSSLSTNQYRNKVLNKFKQLSRNGSPEDILATFTELLNVDKSNVTVKRLPGEPKFKIEAPLNAIKAEFGTTEQIIDIIVDSTASSYGLDVYGIGSFEYITPEEWNNSNYDSSYGYATVDSNGNITSGGTYSGYYNG